MLRTGTFYFLSIPLCPIEPYPLLPPSASCIAPPGRAELPLGCAAPASSLRPGRRAGLLPQLQVAAPASSLCSGVLHRPAPSASSRRAWPPPYSSSSALRKICTKMENKGKGNGKSNETEKIVCQADWENPEMTVIFCNIVVEEIRAGNRPLGTLNARGYKNLREKFFEKIGKNYIQKQLKNRWDNLKTLYGFWKSLWSNSGLGRHPVLGIPTASDEWWETNTKGHLKREKLAFRHAAPPCLKQWKIMFEKSYVSGQSACIPGEEGGGDSIPNEEEEEGDAIQEIGSDQFAPTTSAHTQLKRKGKSRSPNKISPRKKWRNPVVRVMSRMMDDVISSNSVTSKALTGDFTRESVREVMALVKECGAVEGSDEHYIATQLFKHAANREIFLSSFETNEGRFNWLWRCYDERKK